MFFSRHYKYVHLFFSCLAIFSLCLILELDEGNASTLVKFEYQTSSSKNEQVVEKTNNDFLSLLYKVRQPSELEIMFMLKFDQVGGGGAGVMMMMMTIMMLMITMMMLLMMMRCFPKPFFQDNNS